MLLAAGCLTNGLLHAAILNDKLRIFTTLLKNDIDIDEKDANGDTPVLLAIKTNKFSYLFELIDKDADLSCPDAEGFTPLYYAVKSKNIDVTQLLLLNHAPASSLEFEKSPLYHAILEKDMIMIDLLLTYGACPSQENEEHESFLSLAIKVNSPDIFKILMSVGATATNISQETLQEPYLSIFLDNSVPPDIENVQSQDFDCTIKNLKEDFISMKEKLEAAAEKYANFDFKTNLISPIINNQNAMVSTLTRFIKRIDTHSKMLYRKRVFLINSQMESLTYLEGTKISKTFDSDELEWMNMLTSLRDKMNDGSLFSDEILKGKIEKMLHCEDETSNVVRVTKRLNKENLRKDRSQLVFCNQVLLKLLELIRDITETYQMIKPVISGTFNLAMKTMEMLLNMVNGIRQINLNVASIDSKAERDCKMEEAFSVAYEKLQTDISFLTYHINQFEDISILTERCIRMCIQ